MSNVISFCDYRQKKLEEKTEKECQYDPWPVLDFGDLTSATFTVTIDDETFKVNVDLNDFE